MIIWDLQDKMCRRLDEKDDRDENDRKRLYAEVLRADGELKNLVEEMPTFFKSNGHKTSGIPGYILQQRTILLLSIAHKVSVKAKERNSLDIR